MQDDAQELQNVTMGSSNGKGTGKVKVDINSLILVMKEKKNAAAFVLWHNSLPLKGGKRDGK